MKTRVATPWMLSPWVVGTIFPVLVLAVGCGCWLEDIMKTRPIAAGTYVMALAPTEEGKVEFGGVKDLVVHVEAGGGVELRYTDADGKSVVAAYSMGKLVRDGPFSLGNNYNNLSQNPETIYYGTDTVGGHIFPSFNLEDTSSSDPSDTKDDEEL